MLLPPPRQHSRLAVALALGLPAAVLVALLLTWGMATWKLWRVHAAWPPFFDAQVITAAAESWRQGHDPLLENPADSIGRPLNYPRLWHLAFRLGLVPANATWLGAIMLGAFTASLVGFVLRHRDVSPWWFAAALFSPAVLLGVERGNSDLLMFALMAAALAALRVQRRGLAAVAIIGAGALKLFPFAAVIALVGEKRRPSLIWTAIVLGSAIVYLALTWSDLALIRAATPHPVEFAYGWSVLPDAMAGLGNGNLRMVQWLLRCGFVVAAVIALATWFRSSREANAVPDPGEDQSALIAFRMGAAAFVGTFLLGGNFRYRMVFLLLTLPQLVRWTRTVNWRRQAWLALGAAYVGLWSERAGGQQPAGQWRALLIGQTGDWVLFLALIGLVTATLPSWLRPELRAATRVIVRFVKCDLVFVALLTVALWFIGSASISRAGFTADAEEQLLVAGVLARPSPVPIHRAVDLLEIGPASLAAVHPAACVFPRAPIVAARWTSLAVFWVVAIFGYIALRRRHPGGVALLSLVPVLAGLALSPVDLFAWRSTALVASLALCAGCLVSLSSAASKVVATAAAALAGCALGLLPFVNTPGVVLAAGLIPLGFVFLRVGDARRAFAAGTLFSVLVSMSWLIDSGKMRFLAAHYWSNLLHPTAFAGTLWWRTLAALLLAGIASALAAVIARFLDRGSVVMKVSTAAVSLGLVLGVPRLIPHRVAPAKWKALADQMTGDYNSREGDQLIVWGEAASLYALSLKPPATPWIVPLRAGQGSELGARERFIAAIHARAPAFFADTTQADPHPAWPAHEDFPELNDFVRRYYTLLVAEGGARLYGLSGLSHERNVLRVGVVPLRIETMTRADAKVPPNYLREFHDLTRISAHAAAHFAHPVPRGAVRLRGVFGVLPGAYANPDGHTDGGIFIIEATSTDGQRHRLLARTLDPFHRDADRGDQPFDLDLTTLANLQQVELIIDPRRSDAFDWMYWGDLGFATEPLAP